MATLKEIQEYRGDLLRDIQDVLNETLKNPNCECEFETIQDRKLFNLTEFIRKEVTKHNQ